MELVMTGLNHKLPYHAAFFPLFVDLRGKKALVIGGGTVAERRIKVLTAFGAEVTVISPEVTECIRNLASQDNVCVVERKFKEGDVSELKPFLIVAAAGERQANHDAMREAKNLNILASIADRRDECSFYFPAIIENGEYIAGLVSKNGNHKGVKQTAEKIRELLNA